MITFTVPIPVEMTPYGDLSIRTDRDTIKDWCIGLMLLDSKMIDQIDVKGAKRKKRIKIIFHPSGSAKRCCGSMISKHCVKIEITRYDLKAAIKIALRYCRDGVADVDHSDIQVDFIDNSSRYLTVYYLNFKPPISRAQLDKELGL